MHEIVFKVNYEEYNIKHEVISSAKFSGLRGEKYLVRCEEIVTQIINDVTTLDSVVFLSKSVISFDHFTTENLTNEEIANRYKCDVSVDKRWGIQTPWFSDSGQKKGRLSRYNHEFWQDKQLPRDWSQVRMDLEELAGRSLEEQFVTNNEYLIVESHFKKFLKGTSGEDRKLFMCWYKDFKKFNYFKQK